METEKKNRPRDNAFMQQRLLTWRPILAPRSVIVIYLILFFIFTPLGLIIHYSNQQIQEYEFDYTDQCNMTFQMDSFGVPDQRLGKQCKVTIPFNISETMNPPIFMYYRIEGFYQAHRRYYLSRSDAQIVGFALGFTDLTNDCSPIVQYAPQQSPWTRNTSDLYSPCGLIAWSMFNDTFVLKKDDEVICNGTNPSQTGKCSKDNIAWEADRKVKFKKPAPGYRTYPKDYYNETGHLIPNTTDPDFIVWMRTSPHKDFRKIHRIFSEPLEPGLYSFDIVQNYPVKSFSGRKKVILTTTNWIGGKNHVLSITFFVLGALSFGLAILFFITQNVMKYWKKLKST